MLSLAQAFKIAVARLFPLFAKYSHIDNQSSQPSVYICLMPSGTVTRHFTGHGDNFNLARVLAFLEEFSNNQLGLD